MQSPNSVKQTLSNRVQDELRTMLLRGEFEPGAPLRPGAISSSLGVSPTVVREALGGLAGDNLVQFDPHRGYRVKVFDRNDLIELAKVRIEIEGLALRWSIECGDLKWESAIVSALHMYSATVVLAQTDPSYMGQLAAAHSALHSAFVSACPNKRLLAWRETLFNEAEMYRRWIRFRADVSRDVVEEHREIAEACTGRNVDRGVALMTHHIQHTTDLLITHLHIPKEVESS